MTAQAEKTIHLVLSAHTAHVLLLALSERILQLRVRARKEPERGMRQMYLHKALEAQALFDEAVARLHDADYGRSS